MNRTSLFRLALVASAVYNFSAALFFLFPEQLGQIFGLPSNEESPYYTLLLAFIIGLFGGVYAFMALQNKFYRSLILVSAIGKAGVFGVSFFCWYHYELPAAVFITSFGDLLFSILFFCWLFFNRNSSSHSTC